MITRPQMFAALRQLAGLAGGCTDSIDRIEGALSSFEPDLPAGVTIVEARSGVWLVVDGHAVARVYDYGWSDVEVRHIQGAPTTPQDLYQAGVGLHARRVARRIDDREEIERLAEDVIAGRVGYHDGRGREPAPYYRRGERGGVVRSARTGRAYSACRVGAAIEHLAGAVHRASHASLVADLVTDGLAPSRPPARPRRRRPVPGRRIRERQAELVAASRRGYIEPAWLERYSGAQVAP